MNVKMCQFEFTCGRCEFVYKASLAASRYGCLAFWDETGQYQAAVDVISDPLFAQVEEAVRKHPASQSVSARRRGEVVQRVVARLSDLAPSGTSYDPDAKPACPNCRAFWPTAWRSVEPPEISNVDLPLLGRLAWERRPRSEQQAVLLTEVNDALTA